MARDAQEMRVPFGRPAKPQPRGDRKWVRPTLFYLLFGLLCTTNVVSGVGFLMSPDIARLVSGQNEVVLAAYEDRIAQLRVEVDRLHSRQYAQTGNINLQLQELAQQQEILTEQHEYVRLLAQKASELGIETNPVAPVPAARSADTITELANDLTPDEEDIVAVSAKVQGMMDETRLALTAIGDAAAASTDEILDELKSVGITPDLPDAGIGGPFIPAEDGADVVSIVDDANAVMTALTRFKAAQGAIDIAPVHQPLAHIRRISSGYGNRTDPFTKRRAFHAGLDMPAPTGTMVLSVGKGEVTYAGTKSGYGILVEVTHGNGVVTRYGHLSATLVKVGQVVQTGTPIAKVGSTGRSTGPHLHCEVRRNNGTVDPKTFLSVGKRLERFLSAA
jgi:murein DD-endopeptidase MepM/ murein hydrolase activator NlpD